MELQVITEQTLFGKEFRVYGTAEEPLFLAKDIAELIEYSEGNVSHMCDTIDKVDVVKVFCEYAYTNNGTKPTFSMAPANRVFITEDGLYEILMQSRKPIAKAFKKEVKQILKTIRKNGMYATDELLDNPDLLIKVATKLKEERERNKELQAKIIIDKPKVDFFDEIISSEDTIDMRTVAGLLNIKGLGRNKLFELLRTKKILDSRNIPYKKFQDAGYFKIIENKNSDKFGKERVTTKTVVFQKGLDYLRKILRA